VEREGMIENWWDWIWGATNVLSNGWVEAVSSSALLANYLRLLLMSSDNKPYHQSSDLGSRLPFAHTTRHLNLNLHDVVFFCSL